MELVRNYFYHQRVFAGFMKHWPTLVVLLLVSGCADSINQADTLEAANHNEKVESVEALTSGASTLPEFLWELSGWYAGERKPYQHSMSELGIDVDRLWVLHQLFTTDAASDGAMSGAFRIPYFWHWTSPNRRLEIQLLPDKTPLVDLPPPKGFEKYKSLGHIDRKPIVYLGDLASEKVLYFHPIAGEFSSFGWCSEREMAFCSLVTVLGFEAKIVQEGIHVVTRVRGSTKVELVIDTTFGSFTIEELEPEGDSWRNSIGTGENVDWYNKVCHDPIQLQGIQDLPISQSAKERLALQAHEYFLSHKFK